MAVGRFAVVCAALLTCSGLARPQEPAAVDPAQIEEALGLKIVPVAEDLRAHLPTLKPGEGFVIGVLVPNSRAGDLGLRQYDILIALGDDVFKTELEVLNKLAVNDPTRKAPLHIIRGGFAKVIASSGVAVSPTGGDPAAYAPPKEMFKPGGPPAVSMETKRRPDGLLEVTVFFLSKQTGAMEKRKLTGTLETIEHQINGLAREGLMTPNTHDLASVAMHRLRARGTNPPGTAQAKQTKTVPAAAQP